MCEVTYNHSLNGLIFEDINDDYGYGEYGEFKVIIMKKNQYIKATKLCELGGKKYYHWGENASSQALINAIQSSTPPPKDGGRTDQGY